MTLNKQTTDLLGKAMKAFIAYWEENAIDSPPDQQTDPETGRREVRNTDTAMEMLYNYIEERRPLLSQRDFKLIAIEKPFAVPLDETRPELVYIGRFDKVFKYQGRYYIAEHKTTTSYKKDGPFRTDFMESFSPNSQIDGYLYAGHLTYGKDLKAVWVDAALVHSLVHDGFRFIPIDRHLAQLAGWVWETRQWVAQIEANDLAAQNAPGDSPYFPAFAKNTEKCTSLFGLCPYLDLCKMWANPDQQEDTPPGFKDYKWEPFNELELGKAREIAGFSGKITKKHQLYDNTRASDFRKCGRFFYFRHRRHWILEADKRALLFGGAWHRAMDVVWLELAGGLA